MEIAEASSHPSLYKNVLRTFVFGNIVGKTEGTRYDEELFFLGSVLHDLGLTDRFGGPAGRFEVVGADAAVEFLRTEGVAAERAAAAWEAIALQTSKGIALLRAPRSRSFISERPSKSSASDSRRFRRPWFSRQSKRCHATILKTGLHRSSVLTREEYSRTCTPRGWVRARLSVTAGPERLSAHHRENHTEARLSADHPLICLFGLRERNDFDHRTHVV